MEDLKLKAEIMNLVYQGYTYGQIQRRLGCPSRKFISQTIQKSNPELWETLKGDTTALRDK